ncbi:MAG TPA: hypothetical protein VGZ25_13070, partial [Gemmataceae bacterium]|nr:hypothetical protein [Gemmataceae bacterium]
MHNRPWPAYGALTALLAFSWLVAQPHGGRSEDATKKNSGAKAAQRDWPMLGGTPQRNLANTVDKNMPTEWSIKEGEQKNIKWVATLGKQSFGGPTIGGGKIFVGTNNDNPRNPKVKDDQGVVMCFNEADGKFLWQSLHEKLPSEENDWPKIGIVSHPLIDG